MSLEVVTRVAEVREAVARARAAGLSVGLVPTMGALHAGHAALIDRARSETACVVVTIFVNPLQFDRKDDYDRYARGLTVDLDFCRKRGVDLVFAPDAGEVYPRQQQVYVDAPVLSEHLCGMHRSGHFRGVATVVAKLFNMAPADRAYFGEKDAQQLAIIQALVSDLNFPIAIVPVSTVRESDGLAISSRNVQLDAAQRKSAAALYRALRAAAASLSEGTDTAGAKKAALEVLSTEPSLRLEYVEIVDAQSMQPVREIKGPVRIAAALWAGHTRLIDNVLHC